MKKLLLFLSFSLILCVVIHSKSVCADWESLGTSNGAGIGCLYYSNGLMLAGGGGVLVYSTDEGVTWSEITGPNSQEIHLTVDATEYNGRYYVACGNGVFSSINGKDNWQEEYYGNQANQVEFDNDGNAYIVTDDSDTLVSMNLFFRKSGNSNWVNISPKGVSHPNYRFLIDDAKILLKTGNDVFLSTDKGQNWTKAGDSSVHYNFDRIFKIGSKYLASNAFYSANHGIYESEDGLNWSFIASPPDNNFLIAIDYNKYLNQLFAFMHNGTSGSLNISKDNGKTWENVSSGLNPNLNRIYTFAHNPNGTVYIYASDDNIYKNQFNISSVSDGYDKYSFDINVYINNQELYFESTSNEVKIKNVKIYDFFGNSIEILSQDNIKVTLANKFNNSGIYFINFETNFGNITKKIIADY